jgi:hypothetical protein
MADELSQSKDVEIRFYDGTPTTPNYVVGRYIQTGDPLPGTAPRPPERVYLDRGNGDAFARRVSEDDSTLFDGVGVTINFLLNEGMLDFIRALGNPDGVSPWTVNSVTFLPVTSIGNRINGRGVSVPMPLPADFIRRSYLVDMYVKYGAPPAGGSDHFRTLRGLAVDQLVFNQDPPVIRVTWTGMCYGALGTVATWPTGGVEVTP